jgi:hypothetical protein
LGPLLFLLYINDLPKISKLIAYLFADNITLFATHPDPDVLRNFVNDEFKKIVFYFRAHKLSLHPLKAKFILFSNSNPVISSDIKIFINNNNEGENSPEFIFSIERITLDSQIFLLLNSLVYLLILICHLSTIFKLYVIKC